jgi:hypothetical protein
MLKAEAENVKTRKIRESNGNDLRESMAKYLRYTIFEKVISRASLNLQGWM